MRLLVVGASGFLDGYLLREAFAAAGREGRLLGLAA